MEINEINLKHFGRFDDVSLKFHSGLNVIYGENETGKSTICSFIRGMLFGIEKSRKRVGGKDEYTIRQPWENPEYYGGNMHFTSGGKVFYLERSFHANGKRVRLLCEDDGEELNADQGDLEALLDDISSDVYNNTFYYGNRTGETDTALAEEIHNYMVNAASGNLSSINVSKAIERLKKERKILETEKRRKVEEDSILAREMQVRMEYERQEIEALEQEEKTAIEKLDQIERYSYREEPDPETEEIQEIDEHSSESVWIIGKILSSIVAVAGLLLGMFSSVSELKLAAVCSIMLACIGVRICAIKEKKNQEEWKESIRQKREEAMLNTARRKTMNEKQKLEKMAVKQRLLTNLEWVRNAKSEKEKELEHLQEQYDQLLEKRGEREILEMKIAALHLAEETLTEVTTDIYQEYEDRLNERVSAILSEITGGRYDRILVDENLKVRIYSENRVLGLEEVSRGTMEQMCFALRMAVGEILNAEEPLPIILDDAFITYDDERLRNVLKWLSNCGRQVLVFTCQNRENELMP